MFVIETDVRRKSEKSKMSVWTMALCDSELIVIDNERCKRVWANCAIKAQVSQSSVYLIVGS